MKKLFTLLLLTLLPHSYVAAQVTLSYGDASDGDCSFAGGNTTTTLFNCNNVTVTGANTFTGAASYIVIRAQGDVTINAGANLDVSATGSGNNAGPGGGAGGLCSGGPPCIGQAGSNTGGGAGAVAETGTGSAGGGGGAVFSPVAVLGDSNGLVGSAGSFGAEGSAYNPQTSWETTFTGGSGGGAGGGADDLTFGALAGGAGGAGGGAIVIIAKGLITINGNIIANGTNGDPGASQAGGELYGGGGGGGGSGGAIWLITNTSVNMLVNALSVSNGTGGSGGVGSSNNGGAGGPGTLGRIRIDSPTATANAPAGSTGYTFPTVSDPLAPSPTPSTTNPELSSDIEYACSYRLGGRLSDAAGNDFGFIYYFLMGALLVILGLQIPKVLRRHQSY